MKRQADTAIDVYHDDIKPTLEARQRFVRGYLRDYIEQHRHAPTGLELVRYIQERCEFQLIDVNTVRPRLTSMFDAGWVAHGPKRRCSVSGKTALTWEISTPQQRVAPPAAQRLEF